MHRPGFVLEVDERTPPLLIAEGAGCRLERLPLGTRVAYPAESRPGIDPALAIGRALTEPLGQVPLGDLLRPGIKLAIVFTDAARPAPAMARPDVRTEALEQILSLAADAGIDDVRLVAANGLRRAQNEEEIRGLVGERVHRSFASDGLIGPHDAEAPDLVEIAPGVRINRAVAEADLVIDVCVVSDLSHTGWQQLTTGITGAATAWAQLGRGGDPQVRDEVAGVLAEHLTVWHLEIVLDQSLYPPRLAFLGKREWEWNIRDRVNALGLRRLQGFAPHRVRGLLLDSPSAPYGVLAVNGGDTAAVGEASRAALMDQQRVDIGAQADVVIAGPAPVTEHNHGAVMNPLIAAWDTLARTFGAHTGKPAVREGGALILFHPLTQEFNARFHAASADFFAEVLTTTTDAAQIRAEHEERFVSDEWYVSLYRTQNAFHGTHPLQLWDALQPAIDHCGDIIWVGADRASAERLGHRAASTLADALEIASASVGRSPDILHLHTPPSLIADVTA
ncbi:lactate racemase domain-containing protein [Granulicoccus sp. GXG6511]|uniref:lactate racemase domain-containing protein n=1 Tax=Granulicoccus sp. GXG6511 TaxID=3381351 RepID=UPI003D7D65E4